MARLTSKRKTPSSATTGKAPKQRERQAHFKMEGDDEDAFFVSQSPEPKAAKRQATMKNGKNQPVHQKGEDEGAFSSLDFSKYEKVQTRRHGNSKKANRVLEEFKKMTESQVVLAELEAKSAVTNMQRKQKKFTATFAGTFNAIMTDGLDCPENETRNTHGLKTKLDSTKSGCHQVVAEYEDGLQKFSSCHNLLSFHAFQSKSAAELTDAKAILETGRMVGEDKIRAILTGSSISPEDPNQIKASDALFAAKDQDAESLSWAVAAREQGKIMKKLTAAISRMMD